MAEHRILLTDLAEIGYAYALTTGEDPIETKANKHYEELAALAKVKAVDAEVATFLQVKDAKPVQEAIAAEVEKMDVVEPVVEMDAQK